MTFRGFFGHLLFVVGVFIIWCLSIFAIDFAIFKVYEQKGVSDSRFYSPLKNPYFYYSSKGKYPTKHDTIRVDTTRKLMFIKQTSFINDSLDFWRVDKIDIKDKQ